VVPRLVPRRPNQPVTESEPAAVFAAISRLMCSRTSGWPARRLVALDCVTSGQFLDAGLTALVTRPAGGFGASRLRVLRCRQSDLAPQTRQEFAACGVFGLELAKLGLHPPPPAVTETL
jgi:hypothetical protein